MNCECMKKLNSFLLAAVIIVTALMAAPTAFGQNDCTWNEVAKLTASDGAEDDEFGKSVSISGDLLVIGANYDDNGHDSGSAYIYERDGISTWSEVAMLLSEWSKAGGDLTGDGTTDGADLAILLAGWGVCP